MDNVKQFTTNHYITKATILEVGEEVWQKMREWVDESGFKCLEFDYAEFEDCMVRWYSGVHCIVIGGQWEFCYYSNGYDTSYKEEFTAQDILSLLNIKQDEKENVQAQQFKAMKFRVKDKEHSEHIQKWLFEQGYTHCGGMTPCRDATHLFTYTDGCITKLTDGDDNWFAKREEHQEMSFTYTEHTSYTYECVPVQPVKPVVKLIEIGGKQYKEEDILAILNSGFVNISAVEGEEE